MVATLAAIQAAMGRAAMVTAVNPVQAKACWREE
jgi:hypothetical protein